VGVVDCSPKHAVHVSLLLRGRSTADTLASARRQANAAGETYGGNTPSCNLSFRVQSC
jgi:hypothetical protein